VNETETEYMKIEQISIPVLAFFGDKDTQVDPYQGIETYKNALTKA
jgi:hypothetical protein